MASSKYEIGQVVYIRESAAIGKLEACQISGMHYNGTWYYTMSVGNDYLQAATTYGDRISHVNSATLFFGENELVLYCDALELMRDYALSVLQKVQTQFDSRCSTA